MKYSLCAVLASLSLISCGNNDSTIEDPRPIDKEVYQFEFRSYNVKSTVLYTGASGQKSNPDESYLSHYWSLYQQPAWKKISINLKNSSVKLSPENSADVTYNITIINDSVLINDNNSPSYIGDFNKNTSEFTLKRTFRYVKRVPRNKTDGLFITQNTLFGTTRYENIFGAVFTTPSQMTQPGDEVLWSNIEYYYKAL